MTQKRILSSLSPSPGTAFPVLPARGRSARPLLGAALTAVAALLVGGAALPGPPSPPHGTNILVMGTDGRPTAGGACDCADALMLVHVSAAEDRVSVVGLPRESAARLPAHRDVRTGRERPARTARLGTAYAEGGSALTVRTVEATTGLRVDRYLQVDFRRFTAAVDRVGGVETCGARPPEGASPARRLLAGGPALRYLRSRHADGGAGRVRRLQRFLVDALRRLQARRLLTDPVGAARLARTVLGGAEQGYDTAGLVRLAGVLDRVPATATEFAEVPVTRFAPARRGSGAAVAWDGERAARMFSTLDADHSLTGAAGAPAAGDPPRFGNHPAVRGGSLACP
ncbi:LCP family protein [Streptomyces sp. NPDC008150]|uniref:LCP family protein n=1 Tax=Streptomyces sp. NPDC008150 TaxID=3364816 RepID=UPI0036EAE550